MSTKALIKQYSSLPRSVHILCLGTFINRAGTFLVVFLTLWIKEDLGFSIQDATWCMGAYGAGSMLAALIGGQLADAIGRRIVMLFALFGGAALLIILPLLDSFLSIIVCLTGLAMVTEMYRPASSAMIADIVPSANRPHAYGLMYVAINLGFSVAPVAGGFLLNWISYKWLFWGDALTTACYGFIILLFITESKPQRTENFPDSTDLSTSNWFRDALSIITNWPFMVLCAATLCIALVFMQCMSTLPLYLVEQGFTKATYGRIIAINGTMIAVLQIPFTTIISRHNRAAMISLAAVLNAIGFGSIGFGAGAWMFACSVVIWTTGEMMAAPLMPSIVSDMAPLNLRARYMGIFSTAFSGANMIGAPLGGWVLTHYGKNIWTITFGVGMLAVILFLTIYNRIPKAKPSA